MGTCIYMNKTFSLLILAQAANLAALPRGRGVDATKPTAGLALLLGSSLINGDISLPWANLSWFWADFEPDETDSTALPFNGGGDAAEDTDCNVDPDAAEEECPDDDTRDSSMPGAQRWNRVYYRPTATSKTGSVLLLVTRYSTADRRWVTMDGVGRLQVLDLGLTSLVKGKPFAGVSHGQFPGLSAQEKERAVEAAKLIVDGGDPSKVLLIKRDKGGKREHGWLAAED